MLDIGAGELLVIVLVALVVFGPKRLPDLVRRIGRVTGELRRTASELRKGWEQEVDQLKEVADDLKAPLEDLKEPLEETGKLLEETSRSVSDAAEWVGPEPGRGPTSGDAMSDLKRIEGGESLIESGPEPGDSQQADEAPEVEGVDSQAPDSDDTEETSSGG